MKTYGDYLYEEYLEEIRKSDRVALAVALAKANFSKQEDNNMVGGYVKGQLIRKKINELMSINIYDENIIWYNKSQVRCLLDLEIIDGDQARYILNHYERLEKGE